MTHSMFGSGGRTCAAIAISVLCGACGADDGASNEKSEPDAKAFMTSYFQTFDEKNQDAILALYAPSVTAEISGIGKLEGRDEVRDTWLVPFTTAFPDYSHTVHHMTVTDSQVTADFEFKGTHKAPLMGFQPSGKQLVLPITGTYAVDNDVVTGFELEYDVTTVLAAIKPE